MAITNIDGDAYEVDRAIANAIDEMQTEIETLRNALVSLAVFIGGDPCWCRYAKTGEHTEACRTALSLKLWPRPVKGRPKSSDYLPWRDPDDKPAGEGPTGCADDADDDLNIALRRLGRDGLNKVLRETLGTTNPLYVDGFGNG